MGKERLLILDSNSLMNRAFYALPPLTNKEGIHTNAVYGFTTMLLKMREELQPDYVVATFDRKAPTFRHEEYKEYKAGRKKMPEELAEQFPLVKEMLELFSISIFEVDGFEADDLIGTLSVFAEKQGIEVYIVTGDKDALQLATDNVKVVITKKGFTEKEIYDRERMITELGVTPTQFIDVKGLMGDTSDNIPGVPGVGEKTAYKLIQEYGSIENVLLNIDKISGKKIKENLTEYSEQAIFSKKLATIITEVPIEIDLEDVKSQEKLNVEGLKQMFLSLQFKSLVDKLPQGEEIPVEREIIAYEEIDTVEQWRAITATVKNRIFATFEIGEASISSKAYINKMYLQYEKKQYIVNSKRVQEENLESFLLGCKEIFEAEQVEKIVHDGKGAIMCFQKLGIHVRGLKFDTKIAAYLLDASQGQYELKDLFQGHMGKEISGTEEELRLEGIAYLEPLYILLKEKIEEAKMGELLYSLEQPLMEVLAFMEKEGFAVDKAKLEELGIRFSEEILKVQSEIYEMAGEEFNVSSPKQLGKILFEKLDLPAVKKTKTGYSTNAEVLEGLSDKHPIIDKITYYRQLTKINSTYVEGLKVVIDTDGRIHSSLNQTVTTTGRLSSTEPNLQNIPIKYELGREIRKVFTPNNEECVLLSADYSQIELRVLAHIAQDGNLIDAFLNHTDIHRKTASEVFGVPIEEVTTLMRGRAKAVNFGIVYGMGDFSLAKDLKITKKEAKLYIDTYFERYPNVKKYMEEIITMAKEKGYVSTILNRRRFIPEVSSSNKIVKALGERLAMNTPIQGSAADIIKFAMIEVYEELKTRKLKSTLILQVHDELILNVYKDELEEVKEVVKNQMEQVIKLSVPLEVDVNIGNTWYEAK